MYATGWIKRGPVGLIGSTKSDAQQTIGHLVEDAEAGLLHARSEDEAGVGHDAMLAALEAAGVRYTTWEGWELLDAYEKSLAERYNGRAASGSRSSTARR